jgi:hypothetical protein
MSTGFVILPDARLDVMPSLPMSYRAWLRLPDILWLEAYRAFIAKQAVYYLRARAGTGVSPLDARDARRKPESL